MRTLKEIYNGMNETSFKERIKNDLPFFCERVLGLELSSFHREQLEMLDQRYVCIISPRGHLKTTLFSIAYPIWKLWKEENIEICLTSSTIDQSRKTLEKVHSAIEENEFLRELMPTDRKSSWNRFELTCKNRNKYFIKPFNSTIRGTHVNYCICDDILREGNTQEQIKEIFWSIIFPIVQTKRGQLMVVGTPMTENDLLFELGKKDGWSYRRWSAVEIRDGKWLKPLWPERFSLGELKSIREAQGDFKFNIEYMCDVKESFRKAKNIFVGRRNEIEKIMSAVKSGHNVLITGPSGIGKTSLLFRIKEGIENSVYFGNGSGKLLHALCSKANVSTKSKYEPIEFTGILKTREQKIVLFLDDIDDITNSLARDIGELAEGLIIVAAGTEEPKYDKLSWLFKENIKLKPFSLSETVEFITAKTKSNPDERCARKIFWMTKGIPLAVTDFLNELEKRLIEGECMSKAIEVIKPHPSVYAFKTDLFPVVGIIVIAYSLLALRYVARAGDNTGLYLFSGTFGFVLLALIRSMMYKKRRK